MDASTVINVDDIRSYRVELSGFDRNAAKQTKSAFVEDGYFFIISTASKDDVYIKYVRVDRFVFCVLYSHFVSIIDSRIHQFVRIGNSLWIKFLSAEKRDRQKQEEIWCPSTRGARKTLGVILSYVR